MSRSKRLDELHVVRNGFAFDQATGESYSLSETAMQLVAWLKEGCPQEELVDLLPRHFEVDRQDAQRDVENFLASMRSLKLL